MDALWQSGWDFIVSHFYVSPFWWWFFIGAVVVAGASLLGWYFSFLRPVAGIVFVAVASWLFGYRWGETDAERHADAEKERQKRSAESNGWKW